MIKKILIPVDFSENTSTACDFALYFAKTIPSELMLFHVYFDQAIVTDSGFPASLDTESIVNDQLLSDIKSRAYSEMSKLVNELKQKISEQSSRKISLRHTVEGGDPEHEIEHFSRTYQPDLIVMGTGGEGKKGFLEGSVSKRIMNRVSIPVFTIPFTKKIPLIKKVLYTTSLEEDDFSAIRKIIGLLRPFDIKIYCLHILLRDDIMEAEEKLGALRNKFKGEEAEGMLEFTLIEPADLHSDLKEYIHENEISIISFIPHKRRFFRTLFKHKISKKDLLQLQMPLLAIH